MNVNQIYVIFVPNLGLIYFLYALNKHLLSVYQLPGMFLNTENTDVIKIDKVCLS